MAIVLYANGGGDGSVAATDRGLAYGDGVFETILVREGIAWLAGLHLDRLAEGCRRLAIEYSRGQASALLATALKRLPAARCDGVLKLIITRGCCARGYAVDAGIEPTERVLWSSLPGTASSGYRTGIAVRLCRQRLALQPVLAGIKHLNRLEQVLARREWGDDRFAEGLMRDMEGRVVEGISSNLFWVSHKSRLLTPPLDRCGVAGVMRGHIIEELAPACDYTVCEVVCNVDELLGAQEVFVCNSVLGIRPVVRIDERPCMGPGPMTMALQRTLAERIDG